MAVSPSPGAAHPFTGTFAAWLERRTLSNPGTGYRHHHYLERDGGWDETSEPICGYFRAAHDDAIRRIDRLVGPSLHPAGATAPNAHRYPCTLPLVALQGYFGEVLAGMFAEHGTPSGHNDWEIPAFLFRTHLVAFQQLEAQAQNGAMAAAIPGRTGDDCLAFRRGGDGKILAVLFCEAKCTTDHDAGLIADAHDKAAVSAIVDILQLIEVLLGRGTPEAGEWIDALRLLRSQLIEAPATVTRHDAVVYVHQRAPIQNLTWIPPNQPHAKYTARRPLDAFEIRIPDVAARVRAVYAVEVWQ